MNPWRIALYTVIVLVLFAGVATAADAMVITDEERLETFAEEMTAPGDGDRIGSALQFTDPNREPVDVVRGGRVARFDEGQEIELERALREALDGFGAADLETIQQAIELRGEDARVALRVRTGAGLEDAQFDLRRHGDRWLVRRVAIR
jgi:hypothetical protein